MSPRRRRRSPGWSRRPSTTTGAATGQADVGQAGAVLRLVPWQHGTLRWPGVPAPSHVGKAARPATKSKSRTQTLAQVAAGVWGGGKPFHLDSVFTEMWKVDHAELLQAGHSQHEDLLARKKERVATDAAIELDGLRRVLLEGKPARARPCW